MVPGGVRGAGGGGGGSRHLRLLGGHGTVHVRPLGRPGPRPPRPRHPWRGTEAAAIYGSEGAFDPPATRAALAAFARPALLVAGELDLNSPPEAVTSYAALFPDARLTVLPGVSHFPWVDDPEGFASAVGDFLGRHVS